VILDLAIRTSRRADSRLVEYTMSPVTPIPDRSDPGSQSSSTDNQGRDQGSRPQCRELYRNRGGRALGKSLFNTVSTGWSRRFGVHDIPYFCAFPGQSALRCRWRLSGAVLQRPRITGFRRHGLRSRTFGMSPAAPN